MLPGAVLSSFPISGPLLAPRQLVRASLNAGLRDVHYGGVAIGDPTQGIQYQLWTATAQPNGITLSAPKTPEFYILPGQVATWVALAFDQNSRPFIAWSNLVGLCQYYWYDTTIASFRVSQLADVVFRPFASLDDARVPQLQTSDVIFAYQKGTELYFRAQRDRYGIEYDLGPSPQGLRLAQVGMNTKNRFQFAFQNVQGNNPVPPAEFLLGVSR